MLMLLLTQPIFELFMWSVQNFHADIAEPNVITVILHSDKSFVVFATAIIQQFESQRPFVLAEFAGLQKVSPLFGPQVDIQVRKYK